MTKTIKYLTLICFLLLAAQTGFSQPPPPTGPPCWPPPCVPVDGGISLLIVAGLAYGGKKAYDSYKKQDA